MPYISSVERIGIEKGFEKGIQQGIQQGQVVMLVHQLARRFGELPPWVHERLQQASSVELAGWADALWDAESISDVFVDDRH